MQQELGNLVRVETAGDWGGGLGGGEGEGDMCQPRANSAQPPKLSLCRPAHLPLKAIARNARRTQPVSPVLDTRRTTVAGRAPAALLEGGGSKDSGEEDRCSTMSPGLASTAPVRTAWMLVGEVVVTVLYQVA